MHIIGLTGGIASGKSTVSRHLAQLGAKIIDADQIARDIVAPGKPALGEIVREFGKDMLLPDGALNRAALGKLVFGNTVIRERLNQITHPQIMADIQAIISRYQEDNLEGKDYLNEVVVIDAPLLIEAGYVPLVEAVWLVAVDEETQIKRLMIRDGYTKAEAEARLKSQMSLQNKLAYANQVIDNSGTVEHTIAQVNDLWDKLK
ncbi:MAG: dephospho-CoA kinase [Carboxydocellales bacterium]